jgi:hypothetical protein
MVVRGNWRSLRESVKDDVNGATLRTVRTSISQLDKETRLALATDLAHDARLLVKNPAKNVADLATNPKRQGRGALLKNLSDAAAMVYGLQAGQTVQQLVSVELLNGAVMPSEERAARLWPLRLCRKPLRIRGRRICD